MAYATYQDVIDEFKNIDTTNGRITNAKITTWISQAEAYIDGRLSLLYTTPITGTNSLLIVQQISIGLVAQRVARILETKSITPKGDQYIPKDLIKDAEAKLKLIVERKLKLSDAEEISEGAGVKSYSSSNTVERVFKQGVEQW